MFVLFSCWFCLLVGLVCFSGGGRRVGTVGSGAVGVGGGGDDRLAMTMVIETNGWETTLLTRYRHKKVDQWCDL